jgi:hypothetical protein
MRKWLQVALVTILLLSGGVSPAWAPNNVPVPHPPECPCNAGLMPAILALVVLAIALVILVIIVVLLELIKRPKIA